MRWNYYDRENAVPDSLSNIQDNPQFENVKYFQNCGNQVSDWKPCIERRIADQVFAACCERFVPPECRGLCIYEGNPIESRVAVSILIYIRRKY